MSKPKTDIDSPLPDTAIAAIENGKEILVYAQLYYGSLVEAKSADDGTYTCITIPGTPWNTVKLFTPLAAAFLRGDVRYLFYLDRTNTLNNLVYENNEWKAGDLGDLGIVTADYSKLAAATIDDSIHVFYQDTNKNGECKEICGYNGNWTEGPCITTGPPLFGTSLAEISTGSSTPILRVFFQEKDLKLAVWPASDTINLSIIEPMPSPHTPLSAVKVHDYIDLYYTSDSNELRQLEIDSNGTLKNSKIADTTPKGNIATVIWTSKVGKKTITEEITFFQPWYYNVVTDTQSDTDATSGVALGVATRSITMSSGERILSAPVFRPMALSFK